MFTMRVSYSVNESGQPLVKLTSETITSERHFNKFLSEVVKFVLLNFLSRSSSTRFHFGRWIITVHQGEEGEKSTIATHGRASVYAWLADLRKTVRQLKHAIRHGGFVTDGVQSGENSYLAPQEDFGTEAENNYIVIKGIAQVT